MSAGRILVVDDDPQIRRVMRIMLTDHGYEVDDARTGDAAYDKLLKQRFDLVLLDMNMPGTGGIETCRAIRTDSDIPIIMLTVSDREKDKVDALDAGADDYVTKPFRSRELFARIRAAMRRVPWTNIAIGQVRFGDATVDFDARRVIAAGEARRLTPKEFDVIRYLVAHPNKVLTHREILQAVWGTGHGDDIESLRVVVHQLRKKIEADPARPVYLLTESWVGYRLSMPAADNVEPAGHARVDRLPPQSP